MPSGQQARHHNLAFWSPDGQQTPAGRRSGRREAERPKEAEGSGAARFEDVDDLVTVHELVLKHSLDKVGLGNGQSARGRKRSRAVAALRRPCWP